MIRYIVKRLLCMGVTLFIIITLTFVSMKSIPGDPIAAKYDKASPEVRARIEAIYGLDKSKSEQYALYLQNILKGNLGLSITQPSKTANDIIKESFPASARLGILTIVVGSVVGTLGGFCAGIRRKSIYDVVITMVVTIGISVPNFVIASFLQYLFTYKFPIFPPIGWDTKAGILSVDKYVVLPVAALAFSTIAIYVQYMRESVINVVNEDYVLLARACGIKKGKIIGKYILKNSILPIFTITAQQIASLLTGSFVIESVFSIPGIGKYFVNSVTQRDYTVIMAVTIYYSLLYMISMFVMDLLYYKIDPRIRNE